MQKYTAATTQNRLPDGNIACIFQNEQGLLWCCIDRVGLVQFDQRTGAVEVLRPYQDEATLRQQNYFPLLFKAAVKDQTQPDVYWLPTVQGLLKFIPHQRRCTPQPLLADQAAKAPHIRHAYQDKNGILWMVTHGMGLLAFDPATENINRYNCRERVEEPNFTCLNALGILPWSTDTLLICTGTEGWLVFDKKSGSFDFMNNHPERNSLPAAGSFACYFGSSKNIWIAPGSAGQGLLASQK
ncbi:MAG: hypothetical protein AAF828_11620, partial [Bacteroidota bacterium]